MIEQTEIHPLIEGAAQAFVDYKLSRGTRYNAFMVSSEARKMFPKISDQASFRRRVKALFTADNAEFEKAMGWTDYNRLHPKSA